MRTTLDLPDDLMRRVKARAALEGRKMRDLVAEYLQQGLERTELPDYRALRRGIPIPTAPPADHVIPAVGPEELARMEEEEDLDRYHRSLGR